MSDTKFVLPLVPSNDSFDHGTLCWQIDKGVQLSGWVSGDNTAEEPVYIWVDSNDFSFVEEGTIQYRILQGAAIVRDWIALREGERVDRGDDPDDGAALGGKEQLPAGVYEYQFRFRYDGRSIQLHGGTIHVYRDIEELEDLQDRELEKLIKLSRKPDNCSNQSLEDNGSGRSR